MKKILITGAGSYIGTSLEHWLAQYPSEYKVDTLDMQKDTWRAYDFSAYDVVFHVAGIAHADVGHATEEQKQLYYAVNTELAVETAQKAMAAGVKQFLFMSSMIVYGGCKEKIIAAATKPQPANFYGDSKWQADQRIRELSRNNPTFKTVILRPPMIYGKGSKGNYPQLAKMAGKLPIFPKVNNKRSMLYIDNLCECIRLLIDQEVEGVFFPQNEEYTNTSEMVRMIAEVKGHKIILLPGFGWAIKLLQKFPGEIGNLATKAFGDSAYEMSMSECGRNYRVCSLEESIRRTEG
mgnify:CR=1 FL=1